MELYAIVGTGGFGREIMPLARESISRAHSTGRFELVFVDENLSEPTTINGHRAMSVEGFRVEPASNKYFNIAISDYSVRERIAQSLLASGIPPFSIRASNSVCYDRNTLGEGAILCAFTTVTSNARIGRFFHANIYSYVAHDCVIGDFVTFAPDVHCNGGVIVEDYAYIGTGTVIKQGTQDKPIIIGKGAVVGMGAVVTKSVPPFATVAGNPARKLERIG